ncbi:hypothetical protein AWENTII_000664 [Aspergillus wentii]
MEWDRPIAAGLAQSVERETLNLKAAGSTPAFGFNFCWPSESPSLGAQILHNLIVQRVLYTSGSDRSTSLDGC